MYKYLFLSLLLTVWGTHSKVKLLPPFSWLLPPSLKWSWYQAQRRASARTLQAPNRPGCRFHFSKLLFSGSVMSNSLWHHGLYAASQASAISLSLLKLMSILWAGLSQKTLAGRGLELYAYINLEKGIFLSFTKLLWLQLSHKDSCPSMILTGCHLGTSYVCSPYLALCSRASLKSSFLPACLSPSSF